VRKTEDAVPLDRSEGVEQGCDVGDPLHAEPGVSGAMDAEGEEEFFSGERGQAMAGSYFDLLDCVRKRRVKEWIIEGAPVEFDLDAGGFVQEFMMLAEAAPKAGLVGGQGTLFGLRLEAEGFEDIFGAIEEGWVNQKVEVAHVSNAGAAEGKLAEGRAFEDEEWDVGRFEGASDAQSDAEVGHVLLLDFDRAAFQGLLDGFRHGGDGCKSGCHEANDAMARGESEDVVPVKIFVRGQGMTLLWPGFERPAAAGGNQAELRRRRSEEVGAEPLCARVRFFRGWHGRGQGVSDGLRGAFASWCICLTYP